MIDEITHICKDFEKRDPGSKGEKQACEYMAEVLKKDCGCESAEVESFKENPGSFFGWIFFTITFVLVGNFVLVLCTGYRCCSYCFGSVYRAMSVRFLY